jgi:hypothetical protein
MPRRGTLTIRISAEVRQKLEAAAAAHGLSLSEAVEEILKNRFAPPDPVLTGEDRLLMLDLFVAFKRHGGARLVERVLELAGDDEEKRRYDWHRMNNALLSHRARRPLKDFPA